MYELTANGNLTKDATIHKQRNERGEYDLITFTVAVNKGRGQDKKTSFVPCLYARTNLSKLVPYLTKGTSVLFKGEPSPHEWTSRDGARHVDIQCNVEKLELIGSKPQQPQQAPQTAPQQSLTGGDTLELLDLSQEQKSAVNQLVGNNDLPF